MFHHRLLDRLGKLAYPAPAEVQKTALVMVLPGQAGLLARDLAAIATGEGFPNRRYRELEAHFRRRLLRYEHIFKSHPYGGALFRLLHSWERSLGKQGYEFLLVGANDPAALERRRGELQRSLTPRTPIGS